MKITYSNCCANFTIISALLPEKPISFKLRKKEAQVEPVRGRLEDAMEYIESVIANKEIDASNLHSELKRLARSYFLRVLRGEYLVKVTETLITKKATRLDQRRENDYHIVRESRSTRFEWR